MRAGAYPEEVVRLTVQCIAPKSCKHRNSFMPPENEVLGVAWFCRAVKSIGRSMVQQL
jgi:hypothetical protein